jgi:hypothetical protein
MAVRIIAAAIATASMIIMFIAGVLRSALTRCMDAARSVSPWKAAKNATPATVGIDSRTSACTPARRCAALQDAGRYSVDTSIP